MKIVNFIEMETLKALLFLLVASIICWMSTEAMELEGLPSSGLMATEKAKRFYFDANCIGIYDRQMLSELNAVCDNCYNLYRKPHVSAGCRKNCFNSDVFAGCLRDLLMHDRADEFQDMVQMVSGKK